ncbi:MAG: response regulator [Leptospirales bacterium]|nr:response regulator [Leptospirales bacterium]
MKRILVVEDQSAVARALCEALSEALEAQQVTAEAAGTAAAALQSARQNPPDLIFLDIMLPDMSGLDLAVRLRSLPGQDSTPLVFVTARNQSQDRERARLLGCAAFVAKPCSLATLTALAARLLPSGPALNCDPVPDVVNPRALD